MSDNDPGEDFVRVTNKQIYEAFEAFKKSTDARLTRLEVILGIGVLGTLGTIAERLINGPAS